MFTWSDQKNVAEKCSGEALQLTTASEIEGEGQGQLQTG